MQPAFGVIGLGRMAQALVVPLLESGRVRADQLLAVVGGSGSLEQRREALPAGIALVAADDPSAQQVWTAPVQLLAVKPQQLDSVAAAAGSVTGQPLLISVLAGVSLARLQRLFPGHRCVRAVPNTPALVGAGLTALAWGEGIDPGQRDQVWQLFADVGEVLELAEAKLDSFLALTHPALPLWPWWPKPWPMGLLLPVFPGTWLCG